MNRYEQELLSNCSNLDDVTNAGGKITTCAQAIIDNKKEASKRLCRFIEKSVELKKSTDYKHRHCNKGFFDKILWLFRSGEHMFYQRE